MIKIIVTGTGRCGTVYMARLLTSLGVMCGHESIFEHDGLDKALDRLNGKEKPIISNCSTYDILNNKKIEPWFDPLKITADSSFLAAPFLDIIKNIKIIHIVRNPLKVISSLTNDIHFFSGKKDMEKWTKLVYKYCPSILEEKTEVEKACRYYVDWNRMIEKNSNIFLKIEEQPSDELMNFLKIKNKKNFFNKKNINSWKKNKKNIRIHDIPNGAAKDDLINIVKDYGYDKNTTYII